MDQPLIAVRIKDGIFVGNVTAAHDEDFLAMNKCTHVINCAGSEVRDLFPGTVQYLTYQWKDTNSTVCTTVMFDSADRNVESATRFIDKALDMGECVLIHSYFGVSRSCALCAAYLMTKYGWTVDNTLQFMAMAHQDMSIKPYFLRQLRTFAKRHDVELDVFDRRVDDAGFSLDNEQWMLRNTFVNGLVADVQETHDLYRSATSQIKLCEANYKNASRRRRRIAFVDTRQGTGVHSDMTQPLMQPERAHSHVDPATGAAMVVSRSAPGPPPQPILARRGTPNNHRLEGDPATSRGPQVLPLRGENDKHRQQQQQPAVQSVNPEATLAARRTAGEAQERASVQQPGSFTLRGHGSVGPEQQQQPSSGLPHRVVPHAQDTVSRPSPVAVPQEPPTTSRQQPSTTGGTRLSAGGSARTGSNTKVQNPFSVASSTGQPRRGSPLPKRPTAAGGAASGSPAAASTGQVRGRTLQHPSLSAGGSGSRAGSPISQQRPVRASSPMTQPQARAGSPLSRGPAAASSGRANPTQHGVFNSVPHASSTVQRYPLSALGSGGGAAPSGGGSSVRGAPISAVPSSLRTSTGARGSSPLARRANSPTAQPRAGSPMSRTTLTAAGAGGGGMSGSGRNSPQRLAQQYLSGAQPASTYGRETNASVLRRESALARR